MEKQEEPTDYGTPEFWEHFLQKQMKMIPENANAYKELGSFTYDWYVEAPEIIPQMEKYLKTDMQLLNLGCGNSFMSEILYKDGFRKIKNIDFSPTVISMMKDRCKDKPEMEWMSLDFTNMKDIESDSIDATVDKGGFDAVMCSSNWFQLAPRMAKEVHRVLKKDGVWLMCSFSQDRLFYVEGEIDDEEIKPKEKLWKTSIRKVKIGKSEKHESLESAEQLFTEDQDVIFLYILQKI